MNVITHSTLPSIRSVLFRRKQSLKTSLNIAKEREKERCYMTDLITKDHNAIGIDKGDTPLLASHLIAGTAETGRNQTL